MNTLRDTGAGINTASYTAMGTIEPGKVTGVQLIHNSPVRPVMTLPGQVMSAGVNRVLTLDVARLSSGTYFYRVIAEGTSRTYVQASKFTLLK